MTKVCWNSIQKIRKYCIFGPKLKDFYFVHQKLLLDKLDSVEHKYDNSFLIFQPKYSIFVPKNISLFWMKLYVFDPEFKYDISFWNPSRKYSIKAVFIANLRIFIFGWSFVFQKKWGCLCKIPHHNSFFKFQRKNTQIRQFLSYI